MRHLLRYAGDFESACQKAKDPKYLTDVAADAMRDIGFRWFTLIGVASPTSAVGPGLLMTNYPDAWVNEVIEEELYRNDPIHAAALKSVEGVPWNQVGMYIDPTPQQAKTIMRARTHGLKNGYTVAFRDPNFSEVLFSVAGYRSEKFGAGKLSLVRLIGAILHSSTTKFHTQVDCDRSALQLSHRQIECIKFIARGFTDFEIARELSLSPSTVHEYVANAIKRCGVRRRSQLPLVAVRNRYISIEELI